MLWYTADEPDGWQYLLNSTSIASQFIKSVDPYHPISLVLNCFDYYFTEYTLDTDIIMQDAYPIGINATHSIVWDTEVRKTTPLLSSLVLYHILMLSALIRTEIVDAMTAVWVTISAM